VGVGTEMEVSESGFMADFVAQTAIRIKVISISRKAT
jgi:hypothetical protein